MTGNDGKVKVVGYDTTVGEVMDKVVKETLPFYLCMIIALLLITFIPDISLLLPKLLNDYVPTDEELAAGLEKLPQL